MYNTSYHYDSYAYEASATLDPTVVIAIVVASLLVGIAFYVIFGFFCSRIFKKLGVEPSWAAWVPLYNQWKFLEAGGQQGWWMFIPFANVFFAAIAAYNIGAKFGKSGGWVVLYLFLSPVWIILLGSKGSQPVENPAQMNIVNYTSNNS